MAAIEETGAVTCPSCEHHHLYCCCRDARAPPLPPQRRPEDIRTFYWYFRPIVVLAKLLGVLAIQHVHHVNARRMRYRMFSLSNLYSAILFVADMGAIFYFCMFFILLGLDDPNLVWKILLIYFTVARAVMSYLFCNFHSRHIADVIRQLEAFDVKRYHLFGVDVYRGRAVFLKRTGGPFTVLVVSLLVGMLLLTGFLYDALPKGAALQLIDPQMGSDRTQAAAISFGLLAFWQVLPIFIYIYIAISIKLNLIYLNDVVASEVTKINGVCPYNLDNPTYHPKIGETLENVRQLYTILSGVVKALNIGFGKFLAVDQMALVLMFTFNLYVFFLTANKGEYLLYCTIMNVVTVFWVIDVSHRIKEEASNMPGVLQRICLSGVDSKTVAEVQIFMTQLSVQPIHISAAGFFVMDRKQVTSIISSVATYMIVLMQYSPFLKTIGDNGNAGNDTTTDPPINDRSS